MAVSTERLVPILPRPSSLIIPDDRLSLPILDNSSYSPFPTFPGSRHARDPYGLNAYLMHPEESVWDIDRAANTSHDAGLRREGDSPNRQSSLRRRSSVSMFRRPSPLSQPPVGPAVDSPPSPLPMQRKRSNSADSVSTASIKLKEEFLASLPKRKPKTPKSLSSKAFKRALKFGKRSEIEAEDALPPPLTDSSEDLVGPLSLLTIDTVPTTPMTTRSSSNQSANSSASSISSDGVQTPSESVTLDISVVGVKLADALLEVEQKHTRKKSFLGWFGSRRSSKTSLNSTDSSDIATPVGSNGPSPSTSCVDLAALSPSPSIESPSRSYLSVKTTPSSEAPSPLWVSDRLRRMSIMKMNQVRSASPHPFARTLRRQHFNLPDELSLSLQAGKRVFPASVNTYLAEPTIQPTCGLWQSLVIRNVLNALERGIRPTGSLSSRYPTLSSPLSRLGAKQLQPKGLTDFVRRPPFEDRMLVHYPDDKYSPISMARPGYGVWDLDFTDYILALSEVDEPSHTSRTSLSNSMLGVSCTELEPAQADWTTMPRGSISGLDDVEAVIGAIDDADREAVTNTPSELKALDDRVESAANDMSDKSLEDGPIVAVEIAVNISSITEEPVRVAKRQQQQTWDDSDSESDSRNSSNESEDEDEPLAMVVKKQSGHAIRQAPQSRRLESMPTAASRPSSVHQRANSTPSLSADITRNTQDNEEAKAKALVQVAQARARQAQARSGETERLAVSQQRQGNYFSTSPMRHRQSMTDQERPVLKGKSASTTDLPLRPRGRIASSASSMRPPSALMPPASPATYLSASAGERRASTTGKAEGRRYHSFYEASSRAGPQPHYPYPIAPAYPLSHMPVTPTIPMPLAAGQFSMPYQGYPVGQGMPFPHGQMVSQGQSQHVGWRGPRMM